MRAMILLLLSVAGCSVETRPNETEARSLRGETITTGAVPYHEREMVVKHECCADTRRCDSMTTFAVCTKLNDHYVWLRDSCPFTMVCFDGECVTRPPPPQMPFPLLP